MHLRTRNVNTAFRELVGLVAGRPPRGTASGGVAVGRRSSRNGDVLVVEEPVTVTYERPRERVLFNAVRDANPFLHLYESLWMLAGRNDVGPLAFYAKKMTEFSDDGGTLNGAYGNRWRNAPRRSDEDDYEYGSIDQLDVLVKHLKADPNSRRAVLQMWNVEDDLLKIGPGEGVSRDVCCNLSVVFSLREGVLDMTVFNRSNDLVWGTLGADCVHFSVLQEYVAARLGAGIGVYHQVTSNLHAYGWNWRPDEWLADETPDLYLGSVRTVPLVGDPVRFEDELPRFVEEFSRGSGGPSRPTDWSEPFLVGVAGPMMVAYREYRKGDLAGALGAVKDVAAGDWGSAAWEWLRRRGGRSSTAPVGGVTTGS